MVLTYKQKHRRLLSIFHFLRLPSSFSWSWWCQPRTVYTRLHHNGDFYIGSTTGSVFDREQTRTRKYRQLVTDQLAYFEPALKLWLARDNFFEFAILPIWHSTTGSDDLLSREQACQQTFRPIYNRPWIYPLLKKWKMGKQWFGPSQPAPTSEFGRKLVRRYRKRTKGQHCAIFTLCFDKHLQIFKLLYHLGSDTSI